MNPQISSQRLGEFVRSLTGIHSQPGSQSELALRDLLERAFAAPPSDFARTEPGAWSPFHLQLPGSSVCVAIHASSVPFILPDTLLARRKFEVGSRHFWLHVYDDPTTRSWDKQGYLLGLTKVGHDSAAAVCDYQGKVLAFCQEERISRIKHERRFPDESIRECLRSAGIGSTDLHAICIGHSLPWYNTIGTSEPPFQDAFRPLPRSFMKVDFAERNNIARFRTLLGISLGMSARELPPMYFVRHHAAHVFSSLHYADPAARNLALVADGRGEWDTITAWSFEPDRIEELAAATMPDSLGYLFNVFGSWFGWTTYGFEGRLMGLAPYGAPRSPAEESVLIGIRDLLNELVLTTVDFPFFRLNLSCIRGGYRQRRMRKHKERGWWLSPLELREDWARRLAKLVPPHPTGALINPNVPEHRRLCLLAFAIQERLTAVWKQVSLWILQARPEAEQLLLSGGVALNAIANGAAGTQLKKRGVKLLIPPYATDEGLTVGAIAAVVWFFGRKRTERLQTAHIGRLVTLEECGRVLRQRTAECGTSIETLTQETMVRCTVDALAAGESVAVFHSCAEAGPRALGNRSLLFPAHVSGSNERANISKQREFWRPLALAVLPDVAHELFDSGQGSPFMNVCLTATRAGQVRFKSGLHPADNSSRVQIAESTSAAFLHLVLLGLRERGIFGVINTSFNLLEPIVHSPEEALDAFYYLKGVDRLLFEGHWVWDRSPAPGMIVLAFEGKTGTSALEQLRCGDPGFFATVAELYTRDYQASMTVGGGVNGTYPLFRELHAREVREQMSRLLESCRAQIIGLQVKGYPEFSRLLSSA